MCAERKICPGAVKAPGHFPSVTLFAGLVAPGLGLFNGDLSWVLHVAAAWAAVVLGAALRNPDQGLTRLGLRRRLRRERRFRRCGRLRRGLCGWFRRRGRLRRRRRGDLGRGRGLRGLRFLHRAAYGTYHYKGDDEPKPPSLIKRLFHLPTPCYILAQKAGKCKPRLPLRPSRR